MLLHCLGAYWPHLHESAGIMPCACKLSVESVAVLLSMSYYVGSSAGELGLIRVVGALQDAAKTGKPLDAIKLHECQCPPCFTEYRSADGTIDCKPKCDLDTCDERSGICQGGFSGGGGASQALNVLKAQT